MLKIRYSTFETNSSSVHTLSLICDSVWKLAKETGYINLMFYASAATKAEYDAAFAEHIKGYTQPPYSWTLEEATEHAIANKQWAYTLDDSLIVAVEDIYSRIEQDYYRLFDDGSEYRVLVYHSTSRDDDIDPYEEFTNAEI